MGTLTIVRGSSGTGKSTRVQVLLAHLKENYDWEILHHNYTTKGGAVKEAMTGYYFPEINTLLMGTYIIKKTGERRFEGSDHIKKNGVRAIPFFGDLIRSHNDKHVVCEGYQALNPSSFRVRSRYVLTKGKYIYSGPKKEFKDVELEGLGFDRHLKIGFHYDTFEQANERITGRGGKPLTLKSPSWTDNRSNIIWHEREIERINKREFGDRLVSLLFKFDADVNIVKDLFLAFIGED